MLSNSKLLFIEILLIELNFSKESWRLELGVPNYLNNLESTYNPFGLY